VDSDTAGTGFDQCAVRASNPRPAD